MLQNWTGTQVNELQEIRIDNATNAICMVRMDSRLFGELQLYFERSQSSVGRV